MALQLAVTTEHGIDLDNAYVRVDQATIKDKNSILFLVGYYAKPGFSPVSTQQHVCSHDLQGENALKQAYEFLKTLPEFEGAVDC